MKIYYLVQIIIGFGFVVLSAECKTTYDFVFGMFMWLLIFGFVHMGNKWLNLDKTN